MRLSEYLAKSNTTPADFARAIRVSPAAVSRYAAGLRFPEMPVLVRIKAATDGAVTADDFLPELSEANP